MTDVTTSRGTFIDVPDSYALIDDLPTDCAGWGCNSLEQLLSVASRTGTDSDRVPDADGTVPNPLFYDELELTLDFAIEAYETWTSSPSAQAAYYQNVTKMRSAWGSIPSNADSTVAVEAHMEGDLWVADAQIVDFRWTRQSAALRLVVNDGFLVVSA